MESRLDGLSSCRMGPDEFLLLFLLAFRPSCGAVTSNWTLTLKSSAGKKVFALADAGSEASLWEGERLCRDVLGGSLAVPGDFRGSWTEVASFVSSAGADVGLGGRVSSKKNRTPDEFLLDSSSNGNRLSVSALRARWNAEAGVPEGAWGKPGPDGGRAEPCLLFLPGAALVDAACGRSTRTRRFLCRFNSTVPDCPQPQEPPDPDVKLESNGRTKHSLGDHVTYVCPCWKAWDPPDVPPSPFRTSRCFGSLGWEYDLEDLRSCVRNPGRPCPPIPSRRAEAVEVPACTDPEGMHPPGSRFTHECSLDSAFTSGETRATWICQDDGEWAPRDVPATCFPRAAAACSPPGDSNATAFPDRYSVGSTVYCIHNESLQLPLACAEDLAWTPKGFTPCAEGCSANFTFFNRIAVEAFLSIRLAVYPYVEVGKKSFVLGKPKGESLDGNFGAAAFCHQRFDAAGLPELTTRTELESVAQAIRKHVDDGLAPLPYNILQPWKEGNLSKADLYDLRKFWKFLDGHPIPGDLFSPGHPSDPKNGHCSALNVSGNVGFRDVNCSQPFRWALCQLHVDDYCGEFPEMATYTWHWPLGSTPHGAGVNAHCHCGRVWLGTRPRTKRQVFKCFGNIGYDIRSMTACVDACGAGEPTPSLPDASCLDTIDGDTLRFECDIDFSASPAFHCIQGQWQHDGIFCIHECYTGPRAVSHAVLVEWEPRSRKFHATARYKCVEGYAFLSVGDPNATMESVCEVTRYWSEVEDCVPFYCHGSPPSPRRNMELVWDERKRFFGDGGTFSCLAGFRFSVEESQLQNRDYARSGDGLDVVEIRSRCRPDMTWEFVPWECVPSHCLRGPPNVNGTMHIDALGVSHRVGDSVLYECEAEKSFPDGSTEKHVRCLESGEWETLDGCHRVACSRDPPDPPQGSLSDWDGKSKAFGTLVRYSCVQNHIFAKSNASTMVSKCMGDSGTWLPVEDRCHRPECKQEPEAAPLRGSREWKIPSLAGTNVTYFCPKGQVFDDERNSTNRSCLTTGEWESLEETCHFTHCPLDPPSPPENGNRLWDGSRKVGSIANFTCGGNYSFDFSLRNHSISKRCLSNGAWEELKELCLPKPCSVDPPAAPVGGNRVWNGSNEVGAVAEYSCGPKRLFQGTMRAVRKTCQLGGRWEDLKEACVGVCEGEPPAAMEHGLRIRDPGSDAVRGSTSTYRCEEHFRFDPPLADGRLTLKCQNDRLWEPLRHRCRPVPCDGAPPKPPEGVSLHWDGSVEVGTKVTYSCPDRMAFPEGRTATRSCVLSGRWEAFNESCSWLECLGRPPPPPRGGSYDWNGHSSHVGLEVAYRCPGHQLFDGTAVEVRKECLESGNWQSLDEICIIVKCHSDPPDPPVGGVRIWDGSRAVGSDVGYSCPRGMEFEKSGKKLTASCLKSGEWEEIEKCIWVECLGDPASMDVGTDWDGGDATGGWRASRRCGGERPLDRVARRSVIRVSIAWRSSLGRMG
ncbi:unnamed protein product [Darwinula stevensoni]|uniref:Sushi domain-containing protein n=1 Tax=Darwinula stevensoni TaxID=69355 RepID=A0A7R9A8M4_9CRUS|nr:unnamed protein product [Darwinula stevensoni]CAG0896512.1 unnamed protein product [Darwinula stevensoni]